MTYSLKPLSGNVCLRPWSPRGLQPRGRPCLKPLSGNVCLRPRRRTLAVRVAVSQTPLGERVPSAEFHGLDGAREAFVSNPSRGTCAFGLTFRVFQVSRQMGSQTPLGERVPSARLPAGLTPCGSTSQTPLGERVPSAGSGVLFSSRDVLGLKPLSGNVCLRPVPRLTVSRNRKVSNPSRGTCAFGLFHG